MTSFTRNLGGYDLVGTGGTFDFIHEGHQLLMQTAFQVGKKVVIGLSTDELLANKKYKEQIKPYSIRLSQLEDYIEHSLMIPKSDYAIIPLKDPFGPAITNKNLQAHISSMETYQGALRINQKRIENGLKPLILIIIPLVRNAKNEKISSSTLRAQNLPQSI
ncbi:MAG: pantetheine-phosphate adenylyltransferase [Promethearchaeota archaeon]